jgi:hypothetical protein|tara:strand:+ start:939 stop:1535 length:597 start_codon:yes stop_codon:yes gene_type:complete
MAKNKKPRKAYDSYKKEQTLADAHLRKNKLAVWFTCDMKNAAVVSLSSKTIFNPDTKTANAIANYSHYWSYTLVIFCRDQLGSEYLITGEPELPDLNGKPFNSIRMRQNEVAESLDKAHKKFMKDCSNTLHVCNTGWIAFPYKAEIDEETICQIADKHGVWNFKSKFEKMKAEKVKERQETTDLLKRKATPKLVGKYK